MNLEHLKEQRISYGNHLVRVLKASAKLFLLSIAGFIHGIFPFVFTTTVTRGIREVERDLFKRPSRASRASRARFSKLKKSEKN
jgi:hypothetical protein